MKVVVNSNLSTAVYKCRATCFLWIIWLSSGCDEERNTYLYVSVKSWVYVPVFGGSFGSTVNCQTSKRATSLMVPHNLKNGAVFGMACKNCTKPSCSYMYMQPCTQYLRARMMMHYICCCLAVKDHQYARIMYSNL